MPVGQHRSPVRPLARKRETCGRSLPSRLRLTIPACVWPKDGQRLLISCTAISKVPLLPLPVAAGHHSASQSLGSRKSRPLGKWLVPTEGAGWLRDICTGLHCAGDCAVA